MSPTLADVASSPRLPDALVDALSRTLVRPNWLALGVVAAVYPFVPPLPPAVEYAPFLLSVVLFGLPHGAVDHLVPGRLRGGTTVRTLAAVGVVYAVLGGAYAVAWFLAPVASLVGFILLTWLHWGQGDVYAVLAFLDADHLPTRVERALALVVRGGLPMAVPLVSHPVEYRRVATAIVSLFDPGAAAALAPYFTPSTRTAVGAAMAAATLGSWLLGAWRVRGGATRGPWLADVGEGALLWAFFWLVPPVLAIGLYFPLWHSTRHIARLVAVDGDAAAALATGDARAALGRFARDAAPLTVAALAVFGGLAVVVPGTLAGWAALLALYLVGIAVLTLPHVAIVTWMDVVQDVW